MSEVDEFGRWLKQRRKQLDLTQDELAEQVGCSAETIGKLEAGGRRPSKTIAHRLADALQLVDQERADFLRLARPQIATSVLQVGESLGRPTTEQTIAPSVGQPRLSIHASPVLMTKLYRPSPRAERVVRQRLFTRLDEGVSGTLTVIAAPAGFGKSTVLADWLNHRETTSDMIAWLALDAADSDPNRFLRYLIAALQTIAPPIGRSVLNLLDTVQAPPIEIVMPLLVNDLLGLPNPSILVLDDYHVLDAPAIHQAVGFLLDYLPPQLHLVIATRMDPPLPLARLRARGQLTELRADDLRFTVEETTAFFQEVMRLPLTGATVAALEARTEGWIAGLQLAALSLRDRPADQQAQFIDDFTGSHRFVVDYLVDEVLARQPTHIQTFLLQTSILERLSGALCDAVILGSDFPGARLQGQAYSQILLNELERANLFIVPLDQARRWYRYHHLFAQVLRERLSISVPRDDVATLHRNASNWFEQNEYIPEAIEHALTAQQWDRVAYLLEEYGLPLMGSGHVSTVRRWLGSLPETHASAHPFLYLLDAIGLFYLNDLEAAELRMNAVEALLSSSPPDSASSTTLARALGLRGSIARFRGDIASSVILSEQVLPLLPTTDVLPQAIAKLQSRSAFLVNGDVRPANEHLLTATVVEARTIGDFGLLRRSLVTFAEFQHLQGRLRQASATYEELTHAAPTLGGLRSLPFAAGYYFGLGGLQREWNNLDAAEDLLVQGREMVHTKLLVEASFVLSGYTALAKLQLARGASAAANATMREFETLAGERGYAPLIMARAAAVRAHLALMQGLLDAAMQWAETSGLDLNDDVTYLREQEYLILARVRIACGCSDPANDLRVTSELLERLLIAAETAGRINSMIEIHMLQALVLQTRGAHSDALVVLERALKHARPQGYIRTFVDEGAPLAALLTELRRERTKVDPVMDTYVERLLATFELSTPQSYPPNRPQPLSGTTPLPPEVEPLTEREQEVLRLLAAGMSNQAIAEELIVAVGTVKRHVNSILSKLHVQSRLQAVAVARTLNLV